MARVGSGREKVRWRGACNAAEGATVCSRKMDREEVRLQRDRSTRATVLRITRPGARLANLVCSRRKASRTTPVGPVSLLRDDELRGARIRVIGVPVVCIFPVDQDHNVGILLECAGLAQVRKLRTMIGSRLGSAAQLRQHEHRHIQLLGEPFKRSRDRAELQGAVLETAAPAHQLDIVDDQQAQAVFCLQPARFRAHLEDAEIGRYRR